MTDSMRSTETAKNPGNLTRVAIDPVTRVEGHGKVTLLLDAENRVQQARLHIVEFRGFEKFIQGRPYWEVPVVVQRLCGICPVSHHLAAAKAMDQLVGVDALSETADKVRRLLHFGQVLQSHALHFFHLSSPDLLFGFDAAVAHRNIVGVLQDYPDIARQGILLRKFGQEVIRVIAGKRVHGIVAIPGGINKSVARSDRELLLADVQQVIAWAQAAVALTKRLCTQDVANVRDFATVPSTMLSLIRQDGALELYDGGLRARLANGELLFDQVAVETYGAQIREQVKSWSYMKFPYLTALGKEQGWYRVGPLARVNNCDFIDTPLAENERQEFRAFAAGAMVQATLAFHWARMIELLHCAEAIALLLQDDAISGMDLVRQGTMRDAGIGILEAPRGTLIHDYGVDSNGLITRANLIVSTTNNNTAMNESIRAVAASVFDGREVSEPMLNQIEVAIRAYDPCLSCATHALGKMPLEVTLLDANGKQVDQVRRRVDGYTERNEQAQSNAT